MRTKEIVNYLLEKLEPCGVFLWHKNSQSYYLKFRDMRLGSIRVSDHKGRQKYNYTYEFHEDTTTKEALDNMIEDVVNQISKINNFNKDFYIAYSPRQKQFINIKYFELYKFIVLKKNNDVVDLILDIDNEITENRIKIIKNYKESFTFVETI